MFSATGFTYDGIYSESYGLQIASLNDGVVEETTYVVPTIVTTKAAKSRKFYYEDTVCNEPPTASFSVISQTPISDVMQREILMWLDSRRGFKKLVIHQRELDEYTYNCIFKVESTIYHCGNCIGYNLTATFDSPYQYAKPKKIVGSGNGDIQEITIFNDSDTLDEYVYPTIEFTSVDYFDENSNISIINKTDDSTREFRFNGVARNALIKIDNDLKIITSDDDGDLLSKFTTRKWLRLRRGKNILQVRINGQFTITCPQYIKIRL